jgi:serine/threonine protein kinase
MKINENTLQAGSRLNNSRYIIIEVLGQGLFTITYLASQPALNKRVIIYEFFLKEHCYREQDYQVKTRDIAELEFFTFRDQWLNEAKILSNCSECEEIVDVLDTFEENGTAYYINEYIQETDIRDYLLTVRDRRLNDIEARVLVMQIAEGLDFIHQKKILHLNLSPSNVLIDKKGSPVIIQFGIALKNIPASLLKDPLSLVKPGYSPIEMYSINGIQGPFSDIYSLGGILYFLLTGKDPVPANERSGHLSTGSGISPQNISKQTSRILAKALALDPTLRYQNIREMISDLRRSEKISVKSINRWLIPASLAIILILLVIGFAGKIIRIFDKESNAFPVKMTLASQDNPSFHIFSCGDSITVGDSMSRGVNTLQSDQMDSISIGKFYGLLIGVQDYLEPALDKLTNPLSDIHRMAEVLNTNYIFDTIIMVSNPSRKEIFEVFKSLGSMLKENDNFLLFYAGHGSIDKNGDQGYWLPKDAEMRNSSNWISNNDIKHFIYGLKARHILVISDACFGGNIITRKLPDDLDQHFDQFTLQSFKRKSRTSISSSFGEEVPDRSVFLNYLIDNLNVNDQMILTDEELYYLTLESMRNGADERVPKPCFMPIKDVDDNMGSFIFIRKNI